MSNDRAGRGRPEDLPTPDGSIKQLENKEPKKLKAKSKEKEI
jgi:hypothetical protein